MLRLYDHSDADGEICGRFLPETPDSNVEQPLTCWDKTDVAAIIVQTDRRTASDAALGVLALPLGVVGVAGLVVKDTVGGGLN